MKTNYFNWSKMDNQIPKIPIFRKPLVEMIQVTIFFARVLFGSSGCFVRKIR